MFPVPSDQQTVIDVLRRATNDNEAYTITCLYEMDTEVVSVMDAKYVWVNKKAQQMFGRPLMERGHEWQSYTQDTVTRFQSALLGLERARTQNRNTYISPIIMGNGQKRDVAKTVTALAGEHSIYYCTKIEPKENHGDAVHIKDIKLPAAEEFDFKHIFMSDIRELSRLGAFELVKKRDYCKIDKAYAKNNLTTYSGYISIDSMMNASPKLIFDSETAIVRNFDGEEVLVYLGNGPGESFWVDDGVSYGFWIHRCKFCNFVWRSDFVRPDVCRRPATKERKCRRINWWRGAPDVLSPSERAKLAKNPGRKKRYPSQ